MNRYITRGVFDIVLTWKLSRVGRNLKIVLDFVEKFQKYNVSFYSISENFQVDTSSGKFLMQVLASANEYERNIISENVKLAMTKRAKDGYWSGKIAIGYDVDYEAEHKGQLMINSDEAKIIRKIFDLALMGRGYRTIANELNKLGYLTRNKKNFSSVSIKDIITNRIYKGYVRYNRYENWDEKG